MSFETLFYSGRIVDIIIVMIIAEVLLLAWFSKKNKFGITPGRFILRTLPGVFIFLALRCALVDSAWQWIAFFLVASLLSHIFDIYMISEAKADK